MVSIGHSRQASCRDTAAGTKLTVEYMTGCQYSRLSQYSRTESFTTDQLQYSPAAVHHAALVKLLRDLLRS